MKQTIKNNEDIFKDIIGLNVSLQKHIIDDFDELKGKCIYYIINNLIDNKKNLSCMFYLYINISAIVVDLCKRNFEREHTNPGELPMGYRSIEKNMVL